MTGVKKTVESLGGRDSGEKGDTVNRVKAKVAAGRAVCLMIFVAAAASAYPAERTPAQKWFEYAKLGMFIHWGPGSLLGKDLWAMEQDRISVKEYEDITKKFNPVKFNASEWVALAKSAGFKYINLITKHHDGFCLFDSKLTDYDIIDGTEFKRDVVREIAEECRKQGLKIFLYYSLLDWHHPDYYPPGITGRYTGRKPGGNWGKYVAYYQGQLRELCTDYGELGGIWFDGWWDKPDNEFRKKYADLGGLRIEGTDGKDDSSWDMEGTYRLIHGLQPGSLICNNHHVAPFPGEDFQAFERDLPGQNIHGFSGSDVSEIPLETCITLNDSWGYTMMDNNFKALGEIVGYIVGAVCRNANLLINIGPLPSGEVDGQSRNRLEQLGKWMAANGEAIYGTKGGPYGPGEWGGAAWKDRKVFLHVLSFGRFGSMPGLSSKIVSASLLDGSGLELSQNNGDVLITVPKNLRNGIDTVIVLNMKDNGPYTVDENVKLAICGRAKRK